MKKITIEIETVNAAFEDYADGFNETTHVIEGLLDKLISGYYSSAGCYPVFDSNGNKCGKIAVK
jgi:hypothetical protein